MTMTTPLSPLGAPLPPLTTELGGGAAIGRPAAGGPSFEARIGEAIGEVQRLQDNAAGAAEIEAYREIMRMGS